MRKHHYIVLAIVILVVYIGWKRYGKGTSGGATGS